MSVLLRKPRIDEIADGLDSGTLKAFLEALNSNEGYEHYSLRGGNLPKGTAPFVAKCTLSIDGPAELSGVFVRYTNGSAKAAMVAFADLGSCITYDIDEERLTCRKVREKLSASELRRVISERLGGGGGVSADVIRKDENGNVIVNNALEITAEGNAVVGKNLEVDGYLSVNDGGSGIFFNETTSTEANIWVADDGALVLDVREGIEEFTFGTFNPAEGSAVVRVQNLKTLFGNQSLVGEGNIDLYEHHLKLKGSSYSLVLVKESSNNLKCDSIQDLRTLLKTGSDFQYYPIVYSRQTGASTAEANAGYLKISNNVCQITTDCSGVALVDNITTVQDTVTTI